MKPTAAFAVLVVSMMAMGTLARRFYTINGELCVSECALKGEEYYWCYTSSNWDYCSIDKDLDYRGGSCRAGHPCGKHGESYSWCYLDHLQGSWNYCGEIGDNFQIVSSTYGYYCTDACGKKGESYYYWCTTEKGWDYCSLEVGLDYHGKNCDHDDNPTSYCDKHGKDYYTGALRKVVMTWDTAASGLRWEI